MVINRFHLFLIVLFCLLLVSCKKSYSPVEYKAWIESEASGLHKKKTIGNMEYEMQYQTKEYLALLNLGPKAFEKEVDLEKELSNYSDDVQVLFTIRNLEGIPPLNYNLESEMEYYARLQYLNSVVASDFFLLTEKKDTVKCMFAHLERDFGIGPDMKISLAFAQGQPTDNFQLCYNDKLFNNGMIKFNVLYEDLNDLPELRNN